ncbi:hypothetical protein Gohar_028397, partial [Gossypium harknessii]|nr:hypothetical protein [Gossypium harknessii]
ANYLSLGLLVNYLYKDCERCSTRNILFDCIERPNELGFPYWAESFRGKRIIYDEKDELQENDLAFLQNGTMQYQARDKSSKAGSFLQYLNLPIAPPNL